MVNSYLMVRSIQDNGMISLRRRKVMVYKYGPMDQNTKDFGIMIWHVVTEDLY